MFSKLPKRIGPRRARRKRLAPELSSCVMSVVGCLDPALEHGFIDDHLQECPGCASRADFEKALKARVAGLGEEKAPATLRRQLKTLIDGL